MLDNSVFLISSSPAIYNLSTFVFFPSLLSSSIKALVKFSPMALFYSSFLLFVTFVFVLRFVDSGV